MVFVLGVITGFIIGVTSGLMLNKRNLRKYQEDLDYYLNEIRKGGKDE